jgi:hypothetical protein
MAKGIDKKFDDLAWKDFPPTIIIHGSEDPMVLLEASEKVMKVIGESSWCWELPTLWAWRLISLANTCLGPTPAKLFVVPDVGHAFDSGLYLGDPGLVIVDGEWKALEDVVAERLAS